MLLFNAFTLLLAAPLSAASLSGQVFSVQSGDRIIIKTVKGQFRAVVLRGIEAPLTNTPAGRTARRFLHTLMAGKFVSVDYRALNSRAEILGTLLHGGADINLRLIESGHVRVSADTSLEPAKQLSYRLAQKQAQKNSLGMWRQPR